jgi:hypothetical protein
VDASVDEFTAAANDAVVVAYAPSDSDTVAPADPWFERLPGDAVSRALLGPGYIWAKIIRVDRRVEGTLDITSTTIPIATW